MTMSTLRFFALLVAALVGGCDQICQNEVVTSVVSPSGKLKAVIFTRGCGATTGFNTQVSVISESASLPNEPGNVVILEGNLEPRVLWSSASRLSVAGLSSSLVFKRESFVSGVAIAYE